ncbi:PAS domain-containing protein [Lysobacter sp. N42]|uniref:PAS domain-containing protein n=1 Tax=Lysobacter sp. N42 TaxID=2545719 RepID=UPI0014043418|nr:PAS domain-containing protein [Lysobacter sp. N42]
MLTDRLHFLGGGGVMGERVRSFDWAATPLGPPGRWPSALKTIVSVLLASNQPMFVAWGAQRTLIYNDQYAAILGAKRDALGRDFLDVWDEIRADLEPLVAATLRGEPVYNPDITLVMHRHGYPEETHFSFFYSPLRDDAGEVAGLFCACTEITAQVNAERRLKASEARYRGVLANMGEAFALFDRDFRFLEVNDEAVRLLGRTRESLIGRTNWELYPDTVDSPVGCLYREVAATGRAATLEHSYTFDDGRRLWLELRAYPVEDGMAAFFHDITARREAAEAASLAAERVQLALDAGAIVGTWVWSIPENQFIADARFARSFGLDQEECRTGLALQAVMDSIHPDDMARVQAAIAEAMARGGAYRCQYRVRQDDDVYRWVEANGRVEMDADGRPVRFPGVLLDIEERRRTEAERDRADALLRAFIDAVPGVVYAKDLEGRLLVANRGTAELVGRPVDAIVGLTDREFLADPDTAATVMANDRRIMESGRAECIEELVQLPDGTPAWWLSTKAPMLDGEGRVVGLIGSSVDITDRKRIEDALRHSEQLGALALEVAQLGTWVWDIDSDRVRLDARSRQITGLPQEQCSLDAVVARIHPEDRARVEAALRGAASGTGDGAYAEEFRWLHADGQVVWTMSRGQVAFAGEGDARGAVSMTGSMIDVTERRRMIETLRQADRRKDEFLAMLAHELRNPLAPIGTAAQLLKMAADDGARVRQAATIIERQVAHMTEMVDDLLDVSRVTRGLVELERERVDVRAVVAAAIEQAEPLVRARGHRLVTEAGTGPAVVLGDRNRLVQVLSNLLNNAAKYTPPGGRIDLSVRPDGAQVEIRVSDTGIGMDEKLLPHVFDLFTQAERTPDRSQGGLGIGLALVRSIVQLHGGAVSARSDGPGRGSTFVVALPLAAAEPAPVAEPTRILASPRPRRVLVVDDNRDAAETLAAVLALLGHEVEVADNGPSALAAVARRRDWDAFIVDIGMPDMTGHELVGCLRGAMGAQPARYVALTGYGHPQDRALSRSAGFDEHLVKPADVEHIQRLLDAPLPGVGADAPDRASTIA